MATALNTKIVLKNTTKMTLNERFTAYRTEAPIMGNYRQKIQMQRQASSANLRLAQTMANRPTVLAALKIKKRSLQQRLGRKQPPLNGNIKSRLMLPVGKRFNFNYQPVRGRSLRARGRGGLRRGSGTSPLLKDRLGPNPKFGYKKQFGGFFRGRNNFRGNRQSRGGSRGRGGNRQQARSNLRNARGRGRGRGWWIKRNEGNVPTKQELDNQLDEYMAETKSNLDAQLEQYMAQG